MKTNTTSPDEDDNNGHRNCDEETCHQLGAEKNDGTELTVPSVEGHPVDENEPTSAEDYAKLVEDVTLKKHDIFDDLEALARPFDEIVPSEKVLTSLVVRKPKPDEWVSRRTRRSIIRRAAAATSTPTACFTRKAER